GGTMAEDGHDHIMPVAKDVGSHHQLLPHRPLDGESPAVNLRRNSGNDHSRRSPVMHPVPLRLSCRCHDSLSVLLTLTLPTKVPSDSLGRIGSLKRTSGKSLSPTALGSCCHRITHQLRPINMNGRSILSVMSTLAFYASGRFLLHSGQFRSGLASQARAGRSIAMFAWQDRRIFRSDNPGCRR